MIALIKRSCGFFKDEVSGKTITEFIARQPKTYSFKVEDKEGHQQSRMCPEPNSKENKSLLICITPHSKM